MPASDYMRDIDIQTFKSAAALYNVWILVRESNPALRLYERLGFRRVPGRAVRNRAGSLSVGMALTTPAVAR